MVDPRASLIVLVPILSAGCLTSTGDDWQIHGETSIAEGEFFISGFVAKERPAALYFTFALSAGPQIDFYTMDDTNLANYDAGRAFTYAEACSRTNSTRADGACVVQPGSWYVVIDNTDLGVARPIAGANNTAVLTYSFRTVPQ